MSSNTLNKILKSEHKSKLNDWENYARSDQLLGLQCIEQIYKTKGNKRIHILLPQQKQMYQTHESLMKRKKEYSLQEVQQNFRRKQLTTSYQFYHGGYSAPKKDSTNVFEFKSLSQLDLARPLNSISVAYIDNWLSLKDNKKYQSAVLSCLRSLNSKLKLSDPNSTEMKTSFYGRIDWSLSKPVRMDKAGQDLFAFKPNYHAIQKQEEKQRKLKEKLQELQRSDLAKQLTIFKDFKIN